MSIDHISAVAQRIMDNVDQVMVGKRNVTELVLVALLCEGHVLLEDVPGVGKTTLARSVARSISGGFKRIQFTPDLLPSDVSGLNFFNQKVGEFEFRAGPVFTNILLADEINRATPRTQSALLEAMQERTVTIDGDTMTLHRPFLVMATENPIELEGTFPLPEAQLDRFLLRLSVGYPDAEEEEQMLRRFRVDDPFNHLKAVVEAEELIEAARETREVYVDDDLVTYVVSIARATRDHEALELGVSPRGTLALFRAAQATAAIRGRPYCEPDDVKDVVAPVFSHRLIPNPEARLRGRTIDHIIQEILDSVSAPVEEVAS